MWCQALQSRAFKIQFISVAILLLMFLAFIPRYFRNIVEPRQGVLLNDFLLNLLPPADHSTLIFILIYPFDVCFFATERTEVFEKRLLKLIFSVA